MSQVNSIKRVCYDIETLQSCFTYTDYDIDTHTVSKFVLHKDRWELDDLIKHLNLVTHQIGFNNINFDYPILHYILTSYKYLKKQNRDTVINNIYKKAQEIVNKQNQDNFFDLVAIKQKDCLIEQLDLFKLWHFNNKAKHQSLKGLQFNMNYHNVEEMPYQHDKANIDITEIEDILSYNLNDVMSTYEFYKISKPKIALRQQLRDKFNIPCINYPDSKLGEQLMLKLYCDAVEIPSFDIVNLRTERYKIVVKDIIFSYINFTSYKFNQVLEFYKNTIITQTKGDVKKTINYKSFYYDFGLGGLHGSVKAGIYESDNEYIIIDADVASMYPNIAIQNKLYIEHLGNIFCDIYEKNIVLPRLKAKKEGDKVTADALKLAANSVYGKSNDEHSFLRDSQYTMTTTINGQLLLAMLIESVCEKLDCFVLQVNTDGVTIKLKRSDIDKYYEVCKNWENITKLELEFVEYQKMIIRDVNNYMAITTKGKKKYKGAFRPNEIIIQDEEWHKDFSFNIIQIALEKYFFDNIPIKETVETHKNIYDFCGRQKFIGKDYGTIHKLVKNNKGQFVEAVIKQQKVTRYFVSKDGDTFIKNYAKGSLEKIHAGYKVTIFNKYVEKNISEYNLNYSFYIREIQKILDVVEDKQFKLF